MHDETAIATRLRGHLLTQQANGIDHDAGEGEAEEESCVAFGIFRGLRERASMLEFKLRNGDTESMAYNLLGSVRFNPSVGLLLRFSGDVTILVLIRGSNLDAELPGKAVNLTDRGLNRHRITFVREMDEDELAKAVRGQPTIDRIEIAEFESAEEQREWLARVAPAFVRP